MGSAPGPSGLTNPNSECSEGLSSAKLPFAPFLKKILLINPLSVFEDL